MTNDLADKIKRLACACRINGYVRPVGLTLTVRQIFELEKLTEQTTELEKK